MNIKASTNAQSLTAKTDTVRLLEGTLLEFPLNCSFGLRNESGSMDRFDYSWLDISSPLGHAIYSTLKGLLSTHSVAYASSQAHAAQVFFDKVGVSQHAPLELDDLAAFPQKLPLTYLPFFLALLNKIKETASDVLSEEVQRFLKQPEKFEETGKGAYFALVTNDPERGALTEQELKNIQHGVNEAYQNRVIRIDEFAIVWMFIATGVRPIQMGNLTLGDILITDGPDGKEITLMIPLAKGEKTVVTEKWARRAPTVLVDVLLRYLDEKHPPEKKPDDNTPLFSLRGANMRTKLKAIFEKIDTWSDRLEGPIPIHPYRFRYTLGTRALAQGASDHEAARLLTHRTTSSIVAYRAAMPALQRPIKDALSGHMDLLSRAFRGRLINDMSEATRNDDDAALIRDFTNLTGETIGACGTLAKCHQHAPVACLTCDKFEPFADAPWEDLIAKLEDDMDRETEDRIKMITVDAVNASKQIIAQREALKKIQGEDHE